MLFKESYGGSERENILPSGSIYRVLAERNEKLSRDVGIDLVINSSFFACKIGEKKANNATNWEKKSDICFGLS